MALFSILCIMIESVSARALAGTVQLFGYCRIGAVAVSVKVSNLKSYSNLNEKALCLQLSPAWLGSHFLLQGFRQLTPLSLSLAVSQTDTQNTCENFHRFQPNTKLKVKTLPLFKTPQIKGALFSLYCTPSLLPHHLLSQGGFGLVPQTGLWSCCTTSPNFCFLLLSTSKACCFGLVCRVCIFLVKSMSGLYAQNFSPARTLSPHIRSNPDVDRQALNSTT